MKLISLPPSCSFPRTSVALLTWKPLPLGLANTFHFAAKGQVLIIFFFFFLELYQADGAVKTFTQWLLNVLATHLNVLVSAQVRETNQLILMVCTKARRRMSYPWHIHTHTHTHTHTQIFTDEHTHPKMNTHTSTDEHTDISTHTQSTHIHRQAHARTQHRYKQTLNTHAPHINTHAPHINTHAPHIYTHN